MPSHLSRGIKPGITHTQQVQKPDIFAGYPILVDHQASTGSIPSRVKGFYSRYIIFIWGVILIAPWAVLAAGSFVFPDVVYDGFVYPYFVAPIVADAVPGSGESTNYNPVNTAVYATYIAITMLGLYEISKRKVIEAVPVDERLIISLLPLILLGGLLRALQDSALFAEPLTYLFIAPVIYLVLCAIACVIIIFSIWTSYPGREKERITRFLLGCAGIGGAYLLVIFLIPGQMMFCFDIEIAILFIISGAGVYLMLIRWFHPAYSAIFSYGLMFLLYFAGISLYWGSIERWTNNYLRFNPSGPVPRPFEFPLILGITLLITLTYYIAGLIIKKRYPAAGTILSPENILLVFGQMIDGIATWRGVDVYGYSEKNVLPIAVVGLGGSGVSLILMKLLIVLPLIYLLDILLQKEMKGREPLRTIIKGGIMILGMGPGIRDATRIAMGV